MSLPTSGKCDHCRKQCKEPLVEDLGEVVTPIKAAFCTENCRDQFIGKALVSEKLSYEHKEALAGNYPHLMDAHVEGHMAEHKKHRTEKDKKAVVSNPPARTEPIQAGVLTSLRRKFSNKTVVDTAAIASDLIKRVDYYASRMAASDTQIVADGEAVVASMMGRISERGYLDLKKARTVIVGKFREAVKLAGNSQDYFPQEKTAEIKKSQQNPSWSNKELGGELAQWFLASADPSKDRFNHLLMSMQLLAVVQKVMDATGTSGYLFLYIFPIDLRRRE